MNLGSVPCFKGSCGFWVFWQPESLGRGGRKNAAVYERFGFKVEEQLLGFAGLLQAAQRSGRNTFKHFCRSDVNDLTRGTFKGHWFLLCVIKLLCATTVSRTRCGRNGSMVLEFSEMRIGGVRPSQL